MHSLSYDLDLAYFCGFNTIKTILQIDKLGTRCCLILGGIFITTLPPSLFYPIPAVFLTFQVIHASKELGNDRTKVFCLLNLTKPNRSKTRASYLSCFRQNHSVIPNWCQEIKFKCR